MTPALAAALGLDRDARPIARTEDGFAADVTRGLRRSRKSLPSKYFYDEAGSRLFDRICDLPEYYPTRTEMGILRDAAHDIADWTGEGAAVVEFGSGSSAKVRILLDALRAPAAYVPIDISGAHMQRAAEALGQDYPRLRIVPVEGDFTKTVVLPPLSGSGRVIGFFPGSTIGNFSPPQAEDFLREAGETLGLGSGFVVGVDLKKDKAVLDAAYNDAEGVTAAFNLNILRRINRELAGDFNLSMFRHRAFYNEARGRIEMHIESLRPQLVHVAGDAFAFRQGETIQTEISCKYSVGEFQELAHRAGWQAQACFTDPDHLFSVHLLSR